MTDTLARSNIVCVYQDAQIYAPNAFTPYSINNIFQPVISYDDVSNYQLVIYNRAGKKVFETTDYNTGWDGTALNGVQAPLGVYVYVIELIRDNGDVIIERGHVTLVR